MDLRLPPLTASPAALPAPSGPVPGGERAGLPAAGFAQALREAGQAPAGQPVATAGGATGPVTVRRGDTLVGLVKAHYSGQGAPVGDRTAYLRALQVAQSNGLADANRLRPGQTLQMDALAKPIAPPARRPDEPAPPASALPSTAAVLGSRQAHPVLDRTLSRAVERGFIPPHEVDAVRDRVRLMAQDYGFAPDDFARVSLIESDGLNPAASNGRCHGIIQFCGGPGRGAASVGLERQPGSISKMSVLQQLELVDRYFEDVGLQRFNGRVSLEDLYLSVLTPAARSQRNADAPLPIAGQQARVLYEGEQRGAPITRRSIAMGLERNAQQRLGDTDLAAAPLAMAGNRSPLQRQGLAAASPEKP